MAKKLKISAAAAVLAAVSLSVLYRCTSDKMLLPVAISFGTIAYHLVMRLSVGKVFDLVMGNKADYTKRRYRAGRREMQLYKMLKVRKWKGKLLTYDSALFDLKKHTPAEIAQAMCQAELVHETIAVLSFLPIAAGIWLGAFPVFIVSSLLAAMADMSFVIIQRYNRERLLRLLDRLSRT